MCFIYELDISSISGRICLPNVASPGFDLNMNILRLPLKILSKTPGQYPWELRMGIWGDSAPHNVLSMATSSVNAGSRVAFM